MNSFIFLTSHYCLVYSIFAYQLLPNLTSFRIPAAAFCSWIARLLIQKFGIMFKNNFVHLVCTTVAYFRIILVKQLVLHFRFCKMLVDQLIKYNILTFIFKFMLYGFHNLFVLYFPSSTSINHHSTVRSSPYIMCVYMCSYAGVFHLSMSNKII